MVRASEVTRHWREAATAWRRHGELVRAMTEPVTRALVDAAGPDAEEAWLDVASGVGDPAARVAERVGSGGQVVVSDLVLEMAGAAREAVGRPTVVASAEAPPFGPVFDGVTCRFGAMFFLEPERALAGIRAALVPDGRAVFAVWGGPERNPFFSEVAAAVRDVVPDAPAPDPDEPHVFRYAPSGKLSALFRSAGWVDVEERSLPFAMVAPLDRDDYWDYLLDFSADLRELVEGLSEDRRTALRAGLIDRVAPYFREGTMRFPAEARLVVARNREERTL